MMVRIPRLTPKVLSSDARTEIRNLYRLYYSARMDENKDYDKKFKENIIKIQLTGTREGTKSQAYLDEIKRIHHELYVEALMKKATELHTEHSVTRYFKTKSYPNSVSSQKEALSYYSNKELSQVYRVLENKSNTQLGSMLTDEDIDKMKNAVTEYGDRFNMNVTTYVKALESSKLGSNLQKGRLYKELFNLGFDRGYSLEDFIEFKSTYGKGYIDISKYQLYIPKDLEYPINKVESIDDLYNKIGEYSIPKYGRIKKNKDINSGVEFASLKIDELFNAARVLGLTDDEIFDNLNKNMPDFERQLERLELAIYDKDMTREMWANLYIQLARAIDPTLKLANSQHVHNLANQWGSKKDETPTPSIARIRAARKSNNKVKQAFEAAKKSRNSRKK